MSRIYRTTAFELTLSESNVTEKIQLFRVGTFSHPEYGQFEITKQLLAEMKTNFESKVRGIDLAVDYKHDNQDIAAGWIKNLELADDALYANVDWTPKGKQVIADKEFRYISPEFSFDYQDNESLKKHGATLLGAALTNRPVIKKMEPVIELSEVKPEPKKGEIKMEEKDKEIAALKAKCAELEGKLAEMMKQQESAMAEKKMAEKKAKFATMLSEGKVCKAQEEAYIADDMVKFAELAQPMNPGTGHNGGKKEDKDDPTLSVDDKIQKLAEKKLEDKTAKTLSEAYQIVLKENKELRDEKYGN